MGDRASLKEQIGNPKVVVLGSGSWGTALSHHLACNLSAKVVLWGRDEAVAQSINEHHTNSRFFCDTVLSDFIRATTDLREAVSDANVMVFCLPTASLREVARCVCEQLVGGEVLLSTAKGLEAGSFKTPAQVLEEVIPTSPVYVLSGPSFAEEVIAGKPTAVTLAGRVLPETEQVARLLHGQNFRVYTSNDFVGVELCGVLKNIIAVAVGVLDGLDIGLNARAALITRGLAEMGRFVAAFGGDNRTVYGLSGLGDVLLTATGDLSRNRRVGLMLGRGERLEEILVAIGQTAEGVRSAPLIQSLALERNISMPITAEVANILSGSQTPAAAMRSLLSRQPRKEMDS